MNYELYKNNINLIDEGYTVICILYSSHNWDIYLDGLLVILH